MANEILKNDVSFTIDWNDYPAATKYWMQVSAKRDFLVLDSEDTNVTSSTKTVTLTGGNKKYFYRYKPYTGSWGNWGSLNSIILNTGLADDYSVNNLKFKFMDKSDPTDNYEFDTFPFYSIEDQHYYALYTRNLSGNLITSWRNTKARIRLDFKRSIITSLQMNEILRFYNKHNSFYLACCLKDGTDFVRNVWEVMFLEQPRFANIGAGQFALFSGELILDEI